jgi:hypothetical protein
MSDISGLRRCSRCKCTMLLKYFSENKKGELFKICDKCREKNKVRCNLYRKNTNYYENNKQEIIEKCKIYVENNKEKTKYYQKIYWENNKENLKDQHKIYYENTKEQRNKYRVDRRLTDVNFRVLCNLRKRLWEAVKNNVKSASTKTLLGCTSDELKIHLENKFTDGMNWDNYGKWHIDHIIPCCSFDMGSSDKQKECFHFSNLQPLWAIDNLIKGGRILLEEGDILDEVSIMPDI